MQIISLTVLVGVLLLLTGCGSQAFDPVKYQQDQRRQRIFLQEEVRALESAERI